MDIPILFTESNSFYKSLPGTDCYDIKRNALTFQGESAVIAHPPCRLFSRLRAFSTAPQSEKELAYFALSVIQQNGGILEHPANSILWKEKNLPFGNQIDEFGGFTLSVDQHWFGHPARKNTWLYIVGLSPGQLPNYSLKFDAIQFKQDKADNKSGKKEIPKKLRNATPPDFARWLLEIARLINEKKNRLSFIN